MVDHKDASTLTDVCSRDDLDEVELVSLVHDSLPRYRLRVDTVTDFSLYAHRDWGIASGHQIEDAFAATPLTSLQAEATLNYFLLCSDRLTQMTRTYNDIEAITRLLEEKEKDLELAAHIGKSLLAQNKELVERCELLEAEIIASHEKIKQLTHDLSQKEALIKIYTEDVSAEAANLSPSQEKAPVGSKQYEAVQKKLKVLEDDNIRLRLETLNLRSETLDYEEKEHKLTEDCVRQLNDARKRLRELQDELDKKGIEYIQCQEESASLLNQLVGGQQKTKQLTIENLELQEHLKAAQDVQRELTTELFQIKEKYDECKDMLDSSQEEMRSLRQRQTPRVAAASGRYYAAPTLVIPPQDSLAAEIESLGRDSATSDDQKRQNQKILQTAQYVKKLGGGASNGASSKLSSASSSVYNGASARLDGRPEPRVNPLLAVPIPGSGGQPAKLASNRTSAAPSNVSSRPASPPPSLPDHRLQPGRYDDVDSAAPVAPPVSSNRVLGLGARLAQSRIDEVEKLRMSLGRSGIPGSGDLEVALRRLALRQQNEESEKSYSLDHSRDNGGHADHSDGTATPLCRTPNSTLSSSELSCYGSGYGFRMPEKLQIVKPMEGSATLHHWQRLATPHLGGLLEERDGVQIKLEEPHKFEISSYSLNDPEEDEQQRVAPRKSCEQTSMTYTYTTSRIMHPSDNYFDRPLVPRVTVTTMATSSTMSLSSNTAAASSTTQPNVTSSTMGAYLPRPSLMLPIPFAATPAWQQQQATTSTFSVSLSLATILKERGISAAAASTVDRALSGLSINPQRIANIVTESLYAKGSRSSASGMYTSPSVTASVMSSSIF